MRNKKYIYDFVIQVALILVVITLFRTNPNKIHASFWAAALFVLMPISMMAREWIFFKFSNRIWWIAILQFWFAFAIPIFLMRILYAHTSLNEVNLGPISMKLWHQVSNVSYLCVMAATLWSAWASRKKEKSSGHNS